MLDSAYDLVRNLIFLVADLLDHQSWDEWLDLYTDDCIYWVPSWLSEDELVNDPEMQVNMIYIVGKPGLAARLERISSGQAYAEMPLSQTSHVIGTVRLLGDENNSLKASAKWIALSMDARIGKVVRGGRYEYDLRMDGDRLKIRSKKIILLENIIDGAIDIHQI